MQTGLANRVVIVTGGSSGIGRAVALAFGREDARVAVTYRADKEAAASCAAEIEAAGAAAAAFPLDLGSAGSAADLVRQVTGRWGGLDVLVNCAGGRERNGPREGRIVLVSSGAGEEGWEGAAAYAAAKAGLAGLARSLAWELGREGILVNVVAAGLTLTDRVRRNAPPQVIQAIAGRVPSRRLSDPEDVAELIVFLASAANRNVSGEIVREGSATGRSAHAR